MYSTITSGNEDSNSGFVYGCTTSCSRTKPVSHTLFSEFVVLTFV